MCRDDQDRSKIYVIAVIAIEKAIFGFQFPEQNPNDFQPVLQCFTKTVSVSADCNAGYFFSEDCRVFNQFK